MSQSIRLLNKLKEIIMWPVEDYFAALQVCAMNFKVVDFAVIVFFFFLSWWIYVPVHELLHALGCMLGGGEVQRLELSPRYGASFLKDFFPFISPGSEYAGRLTGFDTHGHDGIYFFTVFLPYLLTVLLGIPLLVSVSRKKGSLFTRVIFGASLPVAFSPFISIMGDYYEMGSIIVSRAVLCIVPAPVERWRSDDLMKLVDSLFLSSEKIHVIDLGGVLMSFILGVFLVFLTYALGRIWTNAIRLFRKILPP